MQTKLTTLAVAVALTAMALAPADAAGVSGAPMPNKFWWPEQLGSMFARFSQLTA